MSTEEQSPSTVDMTSKRYAGLRPWQPGQSGNPAGRPKRQSFMDIAHQVLDEVVTDPDTGVTMTKGELLVRKIIQDAITEGSPVAIKELLARWEPTPKQNININNNVGEVRQDVLEWLDQMKVYCPGNGKAE